jgi:hypothetical protein
VSEEPVPPSPVFEDEDLQDVLMQMLAQEQDSTAEENIVSLADKDPANKEDVTTTLSNKQTELTIHMYLSILIHWTDRVNHSHVSINPYPLDKQS